MDQQMQDRTIQTQNQQENTNNQEQRNNNSQDPNFQDIFKNLTEKEKEYILYIAQSLKQKNENEQSFQKDSPVQQLQQTLQSLEVKQGQLQSEMRFTQTNNQQETMLNYNNLNVQKSPKNLNIPYVSPYDQKQCSFQPQVNKSKNKLKNRVSENTLQYIDNYLYRDYQVRQEKIEERKKQEIQLQSYQMKQPKICQKSQQLISKRISDQIINILQEIEDPENGDFTQISFENLGLFLQNLGIFKQIKFTQDQNNQTSFCLDTKSNVNQERLRSEMKVHEQLWNYLQFLSDNPKYVTKKSISEISLILLAQQLNSQQASQLIRDQYQKQISESKLEEFQKLQQPKQSEYMMLQQQEINPNLNQAEKQENQQVLTNDNEQKQLDPKLIQLVNDENEKWSVEELVVEFRSLLDDKDNLMQLYNQKKSGLLSKFELHQQNNEMKFQPEINKYYKTQERSNDVYANRFLELYEKGMEKLKRLNDQQLLSLEEEMKKCTFTPEINRNPKLLAKRDQEILRSTEQISSNLSPKDQQILYRLIQLYRSYGEKLIKNQMKKEDLENQKQIKEIEQCTFKPAKISKVPREDLQNSVTMESVKGANESLIRMSKGRQEKLEIESYWEKKNQSYINHSVNQTTMAIPFNFDSKDRTQQSTREKRSILGTVDVNFQKGKKGKIVIYQGDDPSELSANFCKIYSINTDMQQTLTEMLKNYMEKQLQLYQLQQSESKNISSNNDLSENSQMGKIDGQVDQQQELQATDQQQ